MARLLTLALAALVAGGTLAVAGDPPGPQPVQPVMQWNGSVADEALEVHKPASGVITDAKAWQKLWTDWQLGDKAPAVDFDKQFVVVTTTRGSRLNLKLQKDDRGNLRLLAVATRDLRPGFRYSIAQVSREGIQLVEGKELPKPKKD